MHTAELSVPEPSSVEVEIATVKLKTYKLSGTASNSGISDPSRR
jgi:hypothetical protein